MYPELHTTASHGSKWGQSQKDDFHENGETGSEVHTCKQESGILFQVD